jgi:diaminopimelate epimerase
MRVPFTKMEGVGNDYVFVDAIQVPIQLELMSDELMSNWAARWSDRHFGIGADGLILLLRGEHAPVRMAMWNADGSRGAMCGNGLRCLAKLAWDHGHVQTKVFTVETDAGPRHVELLDGDLVRTAMGDVRCGDPAEIEVAGQRVTYVPGDAGNPHAVVFVDDVDGTDVEGIGLAMQARHDVFQDSVNVEFVQVLDAGQLRQRTFERGSGETLACGTGAAVAALAARQTGRCSGHVVTVQLRGGILRVLQTRSSLAIEGSARTVFVGEVATP